MIPELEAQILRWYRLEQKKIAATEFLMEAQAKHDAIEHDQGNIHDRIVDLITDSDIIGLTVDGSHIAVIPYDDVDDTRIEVIEFQEPLRREQS